MYDIAREVYLRMAIEPIIEHGTEWTENERNRFQGIADIVHFSGESFYIPYIFEGSDTVIIAYRFSLHIVFRCKREKYEGNGKAHKYHASESDSFSVFAKRFLCTTGERGWKAVDIRKCSYGREGFV